MDSIRIARWLATALILVSWLTASASVLSGTARAQDAGVSDPAVEWIREHGWSSQYYATSCASSAGDGSIIWGDPLPVGDGRWLDCTMKAAPGDATIDFQADNGEIWCALGYVSEAWPNAADGDLRVELKVNRYGTPWVLQATSKRATTVSTVSVFGGRAWPIWVDAHFETTDLALARPGRSCDQLFGLDRTP